MATKISQKQLEANRRNAQLSTGPKTPEGKQRVKWNALKHGLLAKSVVIPARDGFENRYEFESLLRKLHHELKPIGILEEMLVEKIAVAYWRLRRAVRAESGEIRDRISNRKSIERIHRKFSEPPLNYDPNTLALPTESVTDKIVRYETSIERRLHKAIEQLELLQYRRRRKNVRRANRKGGGRKK